MKCCFGAAAILQFSHSLLMLTAWIWLWACYAPYCCPQIERLSCSCLLQLPHRQSSLGFMRKVRWTVGVTFATAYEVGWHGDAAFGIKALECRCFFLKRPQLNERPYQNALIASLILFLSGDQTAL